MTDKPVSVVLVHGGFVDGSGWQGVHDIVTKDGYEVIVVQNPTVSLEDDVVVTKRAIAAAKHPVVLVGHSYGGAVITEAGNDPRSPASPISQRSLPTRASRWKCCSPIRSPVSRSRQSFRRKTGS